MKQSSDNLQYNSNLRDQDKNKDKQNYASPRFVQYGAVSALTQGAGSMGNDGGAGFKN